MKTYLAVANAGQLLKIKLSNELSAPKGTTEANYDGIEPIETFSVPGGDCKLYNLNGTWIYVTKNIIAEVNNDEILAEFNFHFSDEYVDEDFGYVVHIAACYIMGYVIGRSADLYRKLVTPFLEKLLYNGGRTSTINIEEYNAFINLEEALFEIKDHIKMFDVMFSRSMNAYVEKSSGLEFTIMDITDCKNIFNSNRVFFI